MLYDHKVIIKYTGTFFKMHLFRGESLLNHSANINSKWKFSSLLLTQVNMAIIALLLFKLFNLSRLLCSEPGPQAATPAYARTSRPMWKSNLTLDWPHFMLNRCPLPAPPRRLTFLYDGIGYFRSTSNSLSAAISSRNSEGGKQAARTDLRGWREGAGGAAAGRSGRSSWPEGGREQEGGRCRPSLRVLHSTTRTAFRVVAGGFGLRRY